MGPTQNLNISDTPFVGMIPKICESVTKNCLNNIKNQDIKAMLVLIDQLPTKISKIPQGSGTLLEQLASPLLKCVEASFFLPKIIYTPLSTAF